MRVNFKATRRTVVKLSDKKMVDGSLSLTLNTDLHEHARLSKIPRQEIIKELNKSLDELVITLSELSDEHRGLVE